LQNTGWIPNPAAFSDKKFCKNALGNVRFHFHAPFLAVEERYSIPIAHAAFSRLKYGGDLCTMYSMMFL
jgi:hypothetical protein